MYAGSNTPPSFQEAALLVRDGCFVVKSYRVERKPSSKSLFLKPTAPIAAFRPRPDCSILLTLHLQNAAPGIEPRLADPAEIGTHWETDSAVASHEAAVKLHKPARMQTERLQSGVGRIRRRPLESW